MRDILDIQHYDCERPRATRLIATRRHTASMKVLRWLSKDGMDPGEEDRTALVLDPGGMGSAAWGAAGALHCALIFWHWPACAGGQVLRYRAVATRP